MLAARCIACSIRAAANAPQAKYPVYELESGSHQFGRRLTGIWHIHERCTHCNRTVSRIVAGLCNRSTISWHSARLLESQCVRRQHFVAGAAAGDAAIPSKAVYVHVIPLYRYELDIYIEDDQRKPPDVLPGVCLLLRLNIMPPNAALLAASSAATGGS